MAVEDLLVQRCTIERPTVVRDSFRELTSQWAAVATNVPCLVQEQGESLVRTHMGRQVHARAVGYLPAGTDVRAGKDDAEVRGDRLVVADTGRSYYVVGVDPAPSGRGPYVKVWLE